MDIMVMVLTQWRRQMLARQARTIRAAVLAMTPQQRHAAGQHTLAEIRAAAELPMPHLYGDAAPVPYRPWSPVASTMAKRALDRAVQVRQRSIGTWLAVVYHETRQAPADGLQAVHREVLGILRELREAKAPPRTSTARLDVAA
jgi:hypothetical protein